MTRKWCTSCGGPRFFERRGGLSFERTMSSPLVDKDARSDDSGYHSGTGTIKEEEDDAYESDISPKAQRRQQSAWYKRKSIHELEAQPSEPTPRTCQSPKRRRSSVQDPQREVNVDSISVLQRSLRKLSTISTKLERARMKDARRSSSSDHSDTISTPLDPPLPERPILPHANTTSARPAPPKRKESSLLHPSTPSADTDDQQPPKYPLPTLSETRPQVSLPMRIPISNKPRLSHTESAPPQPKRPSMPRKSSTLLHPSTPPDITSPLQLDAEEFPFAQRRPPPVTLKLNIPRPPRTKQSKLIQQRRCSIIHSSFSDTEEEIEIDDEDENDAIVQAYESMSGIGEVNEDEQDSYAADDDLFDEMTQLKRISQLVMGEVADPAF